MSFKAKNLSYELKEPSFLRKLKSEIGGSAEHRHERPLARPRKAKEADDDDEPTYVDEESHETITKAEYEVLVAESAVDRNQKGAAPDPLKSEGLQPKINDNLAAAGLAAPEQIADIGARKKRKVGKVVGGDDEVLKETVDEMPKTSDRTAKKKKKVKLSFEQDVD
ncbi:MAG: hypothetical protein M1829_001698 [Trizodia sp. TS-e1964]|nr:MAG: hypothetical protein M1829_001698 [Trizodia sp. TS-e1964]